LISEIDESESDEEDTDSAILNVAMRWNLDLFFASVLTNFFLGILGTDLDFFWFLENLPPYFLPLELSTMMVTFFFCLTGLS